MTLKLRLVQSCIPNQLGTVLHLKPFIIRTLPKKLQHYCRACCNARFKELLCHYTFRYIFAYGSCLYSCNRKKRVRSSSILFIRVHKNNEVSFYQCVIVLQKILVIPLEHGVQCTKVFSCKCGLFIFSKQQTS